jgi:hypothetical protein
LRRGTIIEGMVLPVLVESWQHECCGEDFAVGDTVAWRLLLAGHLEGELGWPEELLVEFAAGGRRESGDLLIVTVEGGVQLAVDPSAVLGGAVVRGGLVEEHHGGVPDEVRPVEGVVRRLRVVRQRHRRERGREWAPVAGAVELYDVTEMPGAFRSFDPKAREGWTELGAVADLEPIRAPAPSPRSPS